MPRLGHVRNGLWIALFATGCGGHAAPDGRGDAPAAVVELRTVVADHLASLEAQCALPDEAGPVDREELAGLVETLAHSKGRMRDLALASVREDAGVAAVPVLAGLLRELQRPAEERVAAAELLAALDDPRAAEPLVAAVETAPEPWLRQWCAFHLASTTQDWIVPRLVLRLKVELDQAAFLWVATTLARFENFAGLQGLQDVAARGLDENVRAQALGQLDAIAARLGRSIDVARGQWDSIDARDVLPRPAPSARLRLEVWRAVSQLSSEHFQLRGVDDARWRLSHMGAWVAEEVAPALYDRDPYVRLHTAQVLARMGARATAAGPSLLRALEEERVAPTAAEALGRVGYPPALEPLLACTAAGRPHELRVAAAAALGTLGMTEALARIRELFGDAQEPVDLRMAAATSLVLLEDGDRAATWLADELAGETDPAGAERALETWLAQQEAKGRDGFAPALKEWRSFDGAPGVIPSLEQTRARWKARAERLRAGALLGG